MEEGERECVRVDVEEGDSVRLSGGMAERGGRPFASMAEEEATGWEASWERGA